MVTMKRRPPTYEEAQRIERIVRDVTVAFKPEHFDWKEHKAEAYALLKAIGEKTPDKSCFSCWVNALNKLRKAISLDPIDHGTTAERATFRLDVCKSCPAYRATTESCGRLIVDALFPEPVLIEGEEVRPCGCYLPLKVTMKHSQCPAGRWT